MTLSKVDEIRTKQLEARKAKDVLQSSLLSTLIGAIEKKSKNLQPVRDLTDDEVVAEIKSMMKGVRETIDALRDTGRDEAKLYASQEWVVLNSLLPSQMTEDEIKAFARKCVARGAKSVGEVMKYFKVEKTGLYDGKAASDAANEALNT